jgi:hypothetical protein
MKTVNWERVWRMSGINFVIFFIVAYVIYGDQPKAGAPASELLSFYDGDRTRILIASVIFGLAVLNLLWFAAAITSTLRDVGQGGWGTAATAASAALGAVFFVLITVNAALAYSIAGSGNVPVTAGLNDLAWACIVMASFPAAMLIMAGSFGLWRAGILSNALFGAGVAAVVLVLLAGTTWAGDGIWAPDGAYSRFISPAIAVVWILGISAILLRSPSTARAPERAAMPSP